MKLLLLINILTNPSAPSSFKQMFKFLSSIRQRALTRACAYDLQPPFPRTDSGKRTFLYSASILFNCLDSDSVVWDSCNINCHQRLLKLQKRAARIILDVDKRTPSIELFNKLNGCLCRNSPL